MSYKEQLDKNRIPTHVAIIMDGNGRWAKQRGQIRSFGHQAGAQTVHTIASSAARIGVKYLTLYTFSTENWNRPVDEIKALMALLMDSLEEETFMKNNISFRVIGDMGKLPIEVQERLRQTIEHTRKNTGMCMVLAISYSSKWELTESVKDIAKAVKEEKLNISDITEETIASYLRYTSAIPTGPILMKKSFVRPYTTINNENVAMGKQVNKYKDKYTRNAI